MKLSKLACLTLSLRFVCCARFGGSIMQRGSALGALIAS